MTDWVQTQTERGYFWTCSDEQRADLAQVISEQQERSEHRYHDRDCRVHESDIVLDLGAHLGVFTRIALEAGAARVVAVEPDPVSMEGLRRTFRAEIESGRVQAIEAAVWDGGAHFCLSGSGIRTNVLDWEGPECAGTTVDAIAWQLDLTSVDFIKLDIEGAEPWALRGASETIRKWKPNIACCIYHHAEDPAEILAAVRRVRDDYTVTAGPVPPWMTTPVLYFFWR